MRRGSGVGVVLLLALALLPAPLLGQDPGGGGSTAGRARGFRLEPNYPNPLNPETRLRFFLGDELFASGKPVVVSIRIYNVLQQLVAVPTALNHPEGNSVPVDVLEYTTSGLKEAFWDGLDVSGRKVASGVYYQQLVVNGESTVRKMVVAK
ncbi:MAG: hypothetical protein HY703_06870 [Gemmatimonadetes bacterium]|nr:hypothetical protein [Gemmatimonadota bacterium]